MTKDEAQEIFTKIALVNKGNELQAKADTILVDSILGIGGSFWTKMVDAMWSTHPIYKKRMVEALPQLISVYRYMTDETFIDEFKERYEDSELAKKILNGI